MSAKFKTIFAAGLCIAIVSLGGFFTLGFSHIKTAQNTKPGETNNINYAPPSASEKQTGSQIKQQNIQSLSNNGDSGQPTSSNTPPTKATTTLTISRLDQSGPGQPINLRTVLSNYIYDGQCVATFSMSGEPTITKSAVIANGPTFYSCEPIDVSASEFSSSGTWQVVVYVQQSGSAVSNKAIGTLVVQKQ